jgi:hypothetical protein
VEKAPDKYLEFVIEKTYASFIESEKAIAASFLTYLLLICLCALLIFGTGILAEDKVTVPLLGLVIKKSYASMIVLILTCGAFYWYTTSSLHNYLLLNKLLILLEDYYGRFPEKPWHLRYPSFLLSSILPYSMALRLNCLLAFYGTLIFYSLILIGYFLPLYFAWRIADSLMMSRLQRVCFYGFVLLLLTPSIATNFLRRRYDADTLLTEIERDAATIKNELPNSHA